MFYASENISYKTKLINYKAEPEVLALYLIGSPSRKNNKKSKTEHNLDLLTLFDKKLNSGTFAL